MRKIPELALGIVNRHRRYIPLLMYVGIALAALLPLLIRPGYVLTLDMIFGPYIEVPDIGNASYPFYMALKILATVIPVPILQKLMLLTIIVLAGTGAHRLTLYVSGKDRGSSTVYGAYFAGILYIINPFTYVRFMDGQFAVLLGYALMPFFVTAWCRLLFSRKHRWRTAVTAGVYASSIAILSIHAIGYLLVIVATSIVIMAIQQPKATLRLLRYIGLVAGIFLLLNSFWIVPTLAGTTQRETLIQQFDRRHLLSFRTDGTNDWAVIGNVLALYGYWGDREGRYALPRALVPLWPVLLVTMLILAGYGFYKMRTNPAMQTLLASALAGMVLAVGIIAVPFSYMNEWLLSVLPLLSAFREPQKFVSLIALFYAVAGGLGVTYLRSSKLVHKVPAHHHIWITGAMLVIPFLYTPTFLWGFAGQLHSTHYPHDWSTAKQQYTANATGKILFLPWHQYMYMDFAGRVIANPAKAYFGPAIISGNNVEIGLIEHQGTDKNAQRIEWLLVHGDAASFAHDLANMNVEYIVISKTADWEIYNHFDQTGFEKVQDNTTLVVYRNAAFQQL